MMPLDAPEIRVTKFTNCFLVKGNRLVQEDLWIDASSGKILKSQEAFYGDHTVPDQIIDLQGKIIAPGFIDVQLNGAAGFDFSVPKDTAEEYAEGLRKVNQHLVKTGITSYLPTVTSQRRAVYEKVLPHLGPSGASRNAKDGAESLGAHVEGPFLSPTKNGIHNTDVLRTASSISDIEEMYGKENLYPPEIQQAGDADTAATPPPLPQARIKKMTAAPELGNMTDLIPHIISNDIIFAIGHTTASYDQALQAVNQGATMITHLFNAMLPFGHRDPGIFGLLGNHSQPSSPLQSPRTSLSFSSLPPSPMRTPPSKAIKHPVIDGIDQSTNTSKPPTSNPTSTSPHPPPTPAPTSTTVPFRPFFGLIADSIHLHPTTLALAHSSHPSGTILVTDAMPLSGLPDGLYNTYNDDSILKRGSLLTLQRNGRLAGSAITLVECLNNFRRWTRVGVPEAVACVTSTPAKMLGLGKVKGTLEGGWDADLVILDDRGLGEDHHPDHHPDHHDGDGGEEDSHANTSSSSSSSSGLKVEQVWKFGLRVF